MAASTAADLPATAQRRDHEVSLVRLWVLRATYAVFLIPPGPFPKLFFHDATERGMINAIHVGLWAIALIGLRYPLQMLPILLFEFAWKTIWLVAYGLPQWQSGLRSPQWDLDIILIGGGPILFGLAIPWNYVLRHYLRQPAERWR